MPAQPPENHSWSGLTAGEGEGLECFLNPTVTDAEQSQAQGLLCEGAREWGGGHQGLPWTVSVSCQVPGNGASCSGGPVGPAAWSRRPARAKSCCHSVLPSPCTRVSGRLASGQRPHLPLDATCGRRALPRGPHFQVVVLSSSMFSVSWFKVIAQFPVVLRPGFQN